MNKPTYYFDYKTAPSWGMIGASRCQGGAELFQCDVQPNNFIKVTIKTAEKARDLHRDWVHGKDNVCEVWLSPTQWAEFLTTMNCGDGVPCTLRFTQKEGFITHTSEDNRLDLIVQERNETIDNTLNEMQVLVDSIKELTQNKKISKTIGENLCYKLQLCLSNLSGSNAEYLRKCIKEEVQDITQQAKANIQAFVEHKIYTTGLQELQKQVATPLLERREEDVT
jgi:hypothetical protein